MSLDRSQVEDIAMLARLKVSPDDAGTYASALSSILDLADRMQSVDTRGIEPLANPLDATQRLRPDEVTEENHRSDFQNIAPQTEAGLYLVPKVIE